MHICVIVVILYVNVYIYICVCVYTDAHIQQPCTEHLGSLVLTGQKKHILLLVLWIEETLYSATKSSIHLGKS